MTKPKVREINKTPEPIDLQNAMFEFFIPGSNAYQVMYKLKDHCSGTDALKLLRFCKLLQNSPEGQAYIEKRNDLVKKAQEAQKDVKGTIPQHISPYTIPEWKEIMELLSKFNKENNTAVILVTHDKSLLSYCSRVINMTDGKIIS